MGGVAVVPLIALEDLGYGTAHGDILVGGIKPGSMVETEVAREAEQATCEFVSGDPNRLNVLNRCVLFNQTIRLHRCARAFRWRLQ